jgi:hypothetical protein
MRLIDHARLLALAISVLGVGYGCGEREPGRAGPSVTPQHRHVIVGSRNAVEHGSEIPWHLGTVRGTDARLVVPAWSCALPVRGALVEQDKAAVVVTLFGPAGRQVQGPCTAEEASTCVRFQLPTSLHGRRLVDGARQDDSKLRLLQKRSCAYKLYAMSDAAEFSPLGPSR